MVYCLLSYKEARELEREGKIPNCLEGHRHVSSNKAVAMEASGTHRWVGGTESRHCRIVPCEAKEWAKSPSQGFSVMQMRRIFREKPLKSARHFGNECGKQPRVSATQCRDVNGG